MCVHSSRNEINDEVTSDVSSSSSTIPQHEKRNDESLEDVDVIDPFDYWLDNDFDSTNSTDGSSTFTKIEDSSTKRILAEFCFQLEMETANKMIDRELNSLECNSQWYTISSESEMLRDERNLELAEFEIRNDLEFLSYGTGTNFVADHDFCFLEPLNDLLKKGIDWLAYGKGLFRCCGRNKIVMHSKNIHNVFDDEFKYSHSL